MGTIHKQTAERTSATWLYPTVPVTEYRTDASAGITKQVLIGKAEGASDFLVRYSQCLQVPNQRLISTLTNME